MKTSTRVKCTGRALQAVLSCSLTVSPGAGGSMPRMRLGKQFTVEHGALAEHGPKVVYVQVFSE